MGESAKKAMSTVQAELAEETIVEAEDVKAEPARKRGRPRKIRTQRAVQKAEEEAESTVEGLKKQKSKAEENSTEGDHHSSIAAVKRKHAAAAADPAFAEKGTTSSRKEELKVLHKREPSRRKSEPRRAAESFVLGR